MNNNDLDYIVSCMATSKLHANIQRIQTEHRMKLAEFWGIKKGCKVLEIGCGQGDTTAVLAYLVGDKGFVHGIDIASPEYGSPITLGDSINFLKNTEFGHRINIDFEVDILSTEVHFPEGHFDFVILSHSSWYLNSADELLAILKKLKKWGKTLCFAEWDTRIHSDQQLPHFLAILIQAQYECFKDCSNSNVRTLFTPMDIGEITKEAGWNIVDETSIYSSNLQDGEWEVKQTLIDFQDELNAISNMPNRLHTLIKSEIMLLGELVGNRDINPLSTFCFIAN
ncbi:MAG: SAM-dependent methyltransferase [Bacillales bacterium]|jgi:SAM-dependent methyltransferase|nr:SAM-dependent methyltransferase [Bacillales bacterium]